MILQRRLPAGRHAPRHAFAPHLTATLREQNTARTRPPRRQGNAFRLQIWGGPQWPTDSNPPNIPRDAQTLMLQRQEANSRFLTECYLFPAALWSGACPKIASD